MNLRVLPFAFAVTLVLSGCKGDTTPDASHDNAATGAATATAPAEPAAALADTAGKIHVDVTGGANAGSYDLAGTDGCSYNIAGKGAWGNQFARDGAGPRDLSGVQLVVPDAKAAAAGTDTFLLTVSFGPQMGAGGALYTIDTAHGGGKGTLKLDDRTTTGTVTFDGTTAEGVRLQGTIECGTVVRG